MPIFWGIAFAETIVKPQTSLLKTCDKTIGALGIELKTSSLDY